MQKHFKFCPWCGLTLTSKELNGRERMVCTNAACDYIRDFGVQYVHWNNPVSVAVVVIRMNGGFVLVKRRANPAKGKWCFVCGFNDEGESLSQSADREALEESGLEISTPELPFRIIYLPFVNQHLMFFEGTVIGGTLKAGDDAEEAEIFNIDSVPEVAFSTHMDVIKELFGSLSPAPVPALSVEAVSASH